MDRDYNDNGTIYQSKNTDTDFRIMRIERYWSYGAVYSISSNDASTSNRSSMGLSVAYFSEKDFFMSYTSYLTSKYISGATEYTKGGGYEFNLGFLSKVTSSFYVGLMFAIRNFSYTEQNTGGVSSSATVSHREVVPMFSFGVNFM